MAPRVSGCHLEGPAETAAATSSVRMPSPSHNGRPRLEGLLDALREEHERLRSISRALDDEVATLLRQDGCRTASSPPEASQRTASPPPDDPSNGNSRTASDPPEASLQQDSQLVTRSRNSITTEASLHSQLVAKKVTVVVEEPVDDEVAEHPPASNMLRPSAQRALSCRSNSNRSLAPMSHLMTGSSLADSSSSRSTQNGQLRRNLGVSQLSRLEPSPSKPRYSPASACQSSTLATPGHRTTFELRLAERDRLGRFRVTHLVTQQRPMSPYEMLRKKPRESAHLFVKSIYFEALSGLFVLISTLFVGLDTDYMAGHGGVGRGAYRYVHTGVNIFFMLELCFRMGAEGCPFLCNGDWRWNWLDIILVSTSIVDLVLSSSVFASGFSQTAGRQLRVIRLLRLLRTVRLLRSLRCIHEFRKMLYAILSSFRTLMCSLVILFFVVYFFAVLLCQGVTDHKNLEGFRQNEDLRNMYGSLGQCLYTLFAAVSDGIGWTQIVTPLMDLPTLYPAAVVIYILIVILGVMNVVTSVFVESAVMTAQHYKELIVDERERSKEIALMHIQALFKQVDADHSGEISIVEMEEVLGDPALVSYIEGLGINPEDTRLLFRLLDVDGSGRVSREEFVDGCLRLQGDARAIDVHALLLQVKNMLGRLGQFENAVFERLELFEEALNRDSRGRSVLHTHASRGVPWWVTDTANF